PPALEHAEGRGLRRSIRGVRRHVGHEQSGRLQLQGVPIEPRVPLGISAGIDALCRLERRASGVAADAGNARFLRRRQGLDAAASGEHVFGEAVLLAESLSDRAASEIIAPAERRRDFFTARLLMSFRQLFTPHATALVLAVAYAGTPRVALSQS